MVSAAHATSSDASGDVGLLLLALAGVLFVMSILRYVQQKRLKDAPPPARPAHVQRGRRRRHHG